MEISYLWRMDQSKSGPPYEVYSNHTKSACHCKPKLVFGRFHSRPFMHTLFDSPCSYGPSSNGAIWRLVSLNSWYERDYNIYMGERKMLDEEDVVDIPYYVWYSPAIISTYDDFWLWSRPRSFSRKDALNMSEDDVQQCARSRFFGPLKFVICNCEFCKPIVVAGHLAACT